METAVTHSISKICFGLHSILIKEFKRKLFCLVSMSLSQKTLNNSFWQLTSVSTQVITKLAVIGILARVLDPKDFGMVAMANLVIAFSGIVYRLGVGPAIIQRQDLQVNHIRISFWFSVISGLLFFVILYSFSNSIEILFNINELSSILKAMAVTFILSGIGDTAYSLLLRELRFKSIFFIEITSYLLGFGIIGIWMAFNGYGVWSLVVSFLVQRMIVSILSLITRRHSMRPVLSSHAFFSLVRFGSGYTLSTLFNYGANNGDYMVVANRLGVSALGLYEQSYKIMLLPARYLGDVLEQVLFSTISTVQHEQNRVRFAYLRCVTILNLILMPLSIVMIMVTPDLVMILLGDKWIEVVSPARILLISVSFRNISRVSDAFARANGAVFQTAAAKAIYALTIVLGTLIGTYYSIIGVSVAVTFVAAVNSIIMIVLLKRIVHLRMYAILKTFIPGFVITLLLVPAIAIVVIACKYFQAPSIIVLLTIAITGMAIIATIVCRWPRFLGTDGQWLLAHLFEYLPVRYKRILPTKAEIMN